MPHAFSVSPSALDPSIWTLTFDLPGEKVNKLSQAVMTEFRDELLPKLEAMGREGKVSALVLVSGKPGNFIAGADIELIQKVSTAEDGQALSLMGHELFARWEDLPFPTVAAIDGAALGGGLELSLASRAIVMSDNPAARVGLPEVMLGVIPGLGGCIRLPARLGIAQAFDLILTGKTLSGERAYRAGLADALLPQSGFADSVLKWTKANLARLKSGERIAKPPKLGGSGGLMGSLLEGNPIGRSVIFSQARKGVASKTGGHYPAPLEAISVVSDAGVTYGGKLQGERRKRAIQREAQGFGKMAASAVSKNLIRIFFMTEVVKKSKGVAGVSDSAPVHTGAVLGAGVMGGGIAQLFADKGVSVRMKDLTAPALTLGIQSAARVFQGALKRRKISRREMEQKINLIAPVTDFSGFAGAEVVVEAIVENIDVKKKVFTELESHVADDCVVASNTSSLSITEMQKAFSKKDRFVGMHFFNPVHRMPLVEVIRGADSSDAAVSRIYQLSKQLGKTPIVVKDSPGFLVNRLLGPYLMESVYLLMDGAPIDELDKALLKFGMPMGPMELIDEVGVDVGEKVSQIFYKAFGERMKPAPLNSKVVAAGRLGKKNGKGIYEYDPAGRNRKLNPEIYGILGVQPKQGSVSPEECVERCVLPMINEAARCLEEGVVASADEVDLGMIMGTGFPPFRGGLLRYADTLGAAHVVEKLRGYEKRFGSRFTPSEALLKRASAGQKFHG